MNVIYADGSGAACSNDDLNAPNIHYLHYPVCLQQRLLTLLAEVKTPYVCMMGDDEFYIPSALLACVDYLECHSNHVACMGRAIGFSRFKEDVALGQQYPRLQGRDLSDDNALNRLEKHFSAYVPAHCYAVTRTDVFRSSMEAALSIELDIFAIFELIHESVVVSAGKSIVLPILYWLRSHEAPPIRNTGDLSLDPSKKFNHWWQNAKALGEKKDFCQYLSTASSGVVDAANVEQVFNCYVEHTWGQAADRNGSLLHTLKCSLPESLKKPLRSLNARGRMLVNQLVNLAPQSNAALQELRDQGVMIDDDGLAECLASIKESWRP